VLRRRRLPLRPRLPLLPPLLLRLPLLLAAPVADSVQDIHVPDIGSSGKAKIIEVLVKAGDSVEADQSLITLESDKASMEIPSPAAGVVESVSIKLDDEVGTGDLILKLKVKGAARLLLRHLPPLRRVLQLQPPLLLLLRPHRLLPRLQLQPSLAPKFTPARPCVNWPVNSASS
jgi:pyruvate dehydrogenase E2 component (dihydrolipoamide acetyltransferase)